MKMIGKNILRAGLCLSAVALLFALSGCGDKKFEWNLPLSLSQHALTFSSAAASTHILVYSTGDWTVGFDRNIDWGSLDRRSGSGNSEFVFSCNANYGISRKVTIRLASGNLRDSIVISQTGVLSSATLQFNASNVTVAGTAATVSVGFSTNLLFAVNDFRTMVTYYDEDGNAADPVILSVRAGDDEEDNDGEDDEGDGEGEDEDGEEEEEEPAIVVEPWISNIVVSADSYSFDVEENYHSYSRSADLMVYVEDADGRQYSATLHVTQYSVGTAY